MRTKRAVSSRRKHSLKVKSGGGIFKTEINKVNNTQLILSCPEFNDLATDLATKCDFIKGNVYFNKYSDGTPKVFMDELTVKLLRNRKVYFLAYFSFNEPASTNIMDQYMFMCSLASYGIKELNIVLPYFPTGTMERIVGEGELGTGYYLAHLLNSIPCGAHKNVLYVMDMHALCSRFFFHTNIRTVFITMMPKYLDIIEPPKAKVAVVAAEAEVVAAEVAVVAAEDEAEVAVVEAVPVVKVFKCIVFPDDGAEKRNKELCKGRDAKFITCSKKRSGDDRTIEITGSIDELKEAIRTKHQIEFYIVDDLVQTGGTLGETAKKLVETLHNEFSPLDAVKASTLNHIKTKCSKPEAYEQTITEGKISDEITKHFSKLVVGEGEAVDEAAEAAEAAKAAKAAKVQEAAAKAVDISTKAKEAIKEAVDVATKAKTDADAAAAAAAEAEAATPAAQAKEAAKEAVKAAAEAKEAAEKQVLANTSGLINITLQKFVIKKKQTDRNEAEKDATKKKADILKDIVNSCIFFSEIDALPTEKRLDVIPNFVINYVVTHSILPKANPVDTIIKGVLFFNEYPPEMVTFNYTTTNSRPYVATTLTTNSDKLIEQPDSSGTITHTMDKNKIIVLSITDVLADVFTDIDSQYIAPYIIPLIE
jgi:phosphoribosylpyrophosphate synthetase